jgi:hypothetical protein
MWRTSNPRNHRAWVTADAPLPSLLAGGMVEEVTRAIARLPGI